MTKLMPPNAKMGQYCIRNNYILQKGDQVEEGNPTHQQIKCQEQEYIATVNKIEDLLANLTDLYNMRDTNEESRNMRQPQNSHFSDAESRFYKDLTGGLADLTGESCWSSYGGIHPNHSLMCAPFHLVFTPGDGDSNYFQKLDAKTMKELTRHWAICQPRKTLILAPQAKIRYMEDNWRDWVKTYKEWGGEIDCIPINIKAMGWNISVGSVSSL